MPYLKTDWPGWVSDDLLNRKIGGREVMTYPNMPQSLYHALSDSAARFGDKAALVDSRDRPYSYREFLELTDAFAAYLSANCGIRKGDHVGLLLYNGIEYCVAFLALSKLGSVAVPLPGKYRKPEVLSLAEKADITAIVCDGDYDGWFEGLERADVKRIRSIGGETGYGFSHLSGAYPRTEAAGELADESIIMFTSGTTAQSKGVLLKNYNIMHAVVAYQRTLRITERDRSVIAAPIYHITGMVALLGLFLYAGGTLWLHDKVDGERMLRCALEHELTFIHASPTIFHLLLERREQFPLIPSLRGFACGSGNMPVQSIRKLKEWLPNADFHTVYGLTETSSPGTVFPCGAANSPFIGSSGIPIPGLEVKITGEDGSELAAGQIGEILVRGAVVLECYYNLETDIIGPDGWLHTGDLGYLNEQGYLYVVDRIKDMINRGGEKICSFDVENEIYSLPGVMEAVVVGVPDDKYGEVPAAAVRLETDAQLNGGQIQEALLPKLARYKIPVRFLFVEEIPHTPNGKTDKKAVRALFAQQQEKETVKC